jgi:diacylglycerol kinase family enzyme
MPSESAPATEHWALLINPRSFNLSQRDRAWQLETLARRSRIPVVRVHDRESIADALDCVVTNGAELIAIAGGDGTIQATLSHFAASAAGRVPKLMILGGGRTNLTPRDFGARQGPLGVFARARRAGGRLQKLRRQVLTLSQPGGVTTSGFFLAGSLIDQLIRDCHRYRAASGGTLREGRPSTAWFLLRTAALATTGRYRYQPPRLSVTGAGLGEISGRIALLACTTLDHNADLINPYAQRGDGPIRLSAVRSDAEDLWRYLPRIVRGRYNTAMNVDTGYLSGRCELVRISGLRTVALDGQELELDPTVALEIRAGPEFQFLQP